MKSVRALICTSVKYSPNDVNAAGALLFPSAFLELAPIVPIAVVEADVAIFFDTLKVLPLPFFALLSVGREGAETSVPAMTALLLQDSGRCSSAKPAAPPT